MYTGVVVVTKQQNPMEKYWAFATVVLVIALSFLQCTGDKKHCTWDSYCYSFNGFVLLWERKSHGGSSVETQRKKEKEC